MALLVEGAESPRRRVRAMSRHFLDRADAQQQVSELDVARSTLSGSPPPALVHLPVR